MRTQHPSAETELLRGRESRGIPAPTAQLFPASPSHTRLFYRYQDLAPQLVPLDYTSSPDVKVPYELISSMPELKVCPAVWQARTHRMDGPCRIPIRWVLQLFPFYR